jgi:hypothetical protein
LNPIDENLVKLPSNLEELNTECVQ